MAGQESQSTGVVHVVSSMVAAATVSSTAIQVNHTLTVRAETPVFSPMAPIMPSTTANLMPNISIPQIPTIPTGIGSLTSNLAGVSNMSTATTQNSEANKSTTDKNESTTSSTEKSSSTSEKAPEKEVHPAVLEGAKKFAEANGLSEGETKSLVNEVVASVSENPSIAAIATTSSENSSSDSSSNSSSSTSDTSTSSTQVSSSQSSSTPTISIPTFAPVIISVPVVPVIAPAPQPAPAPQVVDQVEIYVGP